MSKDNTLIEPVVSGLFYPDSVDRLKNQIENLFSLSEGVNDEAQAIISPHAAYRYCGHLCATAFKAASSREVKTAVVLSCVHREPEEKIFLPGREGFLTPLGTVYVDQKLKTRLLAQSKRVVESNIPFEEEHAIEVQLPFIQYLFPKVKLLPILIGKSSSINTETLTKSLLNTLLDIFETCLFVISSNASGFLPERRSKDEAEKLIQLVKKKDWQGILDAKSRGEVSACGAGSIAAFLKLILSLGIDMEVKTLGEGCSSKSSGKSDNIVQYRAVGFFPEPVSR
ncbi:MAG: AmmeMemoRadiSam system protein B [Spirochaetes bacterium]|nr:MAG: AmmeMemoRadiSam system protein B [Spirochaetota bacterium]